MPTLEPKLQAARSSARRARARGWEFRQGRAPQPLNPSASQPLNPSSPHPLSSSAPQPLNPSAPQPLSPSAPQPLNPSAPQLLSSSTPRLLRSSAPRLLSSSTPRLLGSSFVFLALCAVAGAPPVDRRGVELGAGATEGQGLRAITSGVAWYGIGQRWDYAASNLGFGGLYASAFIEFGEKIFWISGSRDASPLTNEVWGAEGAGTSWSQGPAQAFGARKYASVVEHRGQVFLIGGWKGGAEHWNDVWVASDPSNLVFEEVLPHDFKGHNGTFPGRREAMAVSFQDKLYLLGGTGACNAPEDCYGLKEVWESNDGKFWNQSSVVGNWPAFSTDMQLTGLATSEAIYVFSERVVATLTPHPEGLEWRVLATLDGGYAGSFGIRGKVLKEFGYLWAFPRQVDTSGGIDDKILFSPDLGLTWSSFHPIDNNLGNDFSALGVMEYGVFLKDAKFCLVGGRKGNTPQDQMWCSTRPKFPAPKIQALSAISPASIQLLRDPAPESETLQTVYWTDWYGTGQRTNLLSSNITLLMTTRGDKVSDPLTISAEVVFYGTSISAFTNSESSSLSFTIKRALDPPSFLYGSSVVQDGAVITSGQGTTPQLDLVCSQAGSDSPSVDYSISSGGSSSSGSQCASPCSLTLSQGLSTITASCRHSNWPDGPVVTLGVTAEFNLTSSGGGTVQNPQNPGSDPGSGDSPSPPPGSPSTPSAPSSPPPPTVVYQISACDELCSAQSCVAGGSLKTSGQGAVLISSVPSESITNVQFRSDALGTLPCQQVQTSQGISGHCCLYPASFGSFDLFADQSSNLGSVKYQTPRILSLRAQALSTAGGSAVTIVGENFGSTFVGMDKTGSGPWAVGVSSVATGIQVDAWVGSQETENRVQSLEWVSDQAIVVTAPPGIGKDREIILHIGDHQLVPPSSSDNRTVSYKIPQITSVEPSLSPEEGGITVTIHGSNFGQTTSAVQAQLGSKLCNEPTWKSDSELECVSAAHEGVLLTVYAVIGSQTGWLLGAFSYTQSSPFVTIVVGETVEELTNPGGSSSDAALTKLDDFKTWMQGVLFLVSADQVYISRLEQVSTRRNTQSTRIWMKMLGSSSDPDRYEGDIANLYFLANSADGFQGSGLSVQAIKIPGNPEVVLVEPSPPPVVGGEATPSGGGNDNGVVIGLAVACFVLFVALLFSFYTWRRRLYTVVAEAAGIGASDPVPPTPSRQSLLNRPSMVGSGASVSSRVETVFVNTPSSSGQGPGFGDDICDQCKRSGFSFCVHRMGPKPAVQPEPSPTAPELSSLDEFDELCVVCMDAPREAIVVHDDEKKTTHQVLCLACSYMVIEHDAPCPLCRAPILAVFNARTGADVT